MKPVKLVMVLLMAALACHTLCAKTIYGNAYSNTLNGTSSADTIVAYAGNDKVNAGGGSDTVYGGKNDDILDGQAGDDRLFGDRNNDKLYGDLGNDRLFGGKDHDNLYGEAGHDQLHGQQGNDYLSGGRGNDKYYYRYGDGYDTIFQDTQGYDQLIISGIATASISISVSGNDKIISVPYGRITIKNYLTNTIESIKANGVELNNDSPPPSISSISYITKPLVKGQDETLQVTLAESGYSWQKRTYFVEVIISRSYGSWKVASGYISIAANTTRAAANFNIKFSEAGDVYTKIKVYNASKTELLVERIGSSSDHVENSGGSTSYIQNFPYFYQLYNNYNPYGSCQNTSIAMVLKYYGASVTPDQISNYWGTSYAQTVGGLNTVFNTEAAYRGVSQRVQSTPYGTLSRVNQSLAAGKPVIVQGYTTNYGHVLVLLGFDGTYYYAHDPYGQWDQVPYSSGYWNTASAGKYVKYHKNAIRDAFAPDGYVWMHEIY